MTEPATPVTEEEILAFVRASLASVWELELLLLLYRSPQRHWDAKEIDRQLRASETVVAYALRRLRVAGLVAETTKDRFQYRPGLPRLHAIVQALEIAYRTNPISVVKVILGAPDSNLRIFSEAFRLKE
ncbi:MAG TPA: hypothetical protein VHX61_06315 [Rhizomicrobium sp.]|nr:hypothetical protein [Rhizomicrobium sp.]